MKQMQEYAKHAQLPQNEICDIGDLPEPWKGITTNGYTFLSCVVFVVVFALILYVSLLHQ